MKLENALDVALIALASVGVGLGIQMLSAFTITASVFVLVNVVRGAIVRRLSGTPSVSKAFIRCAKCGQINRLKA